MPWFHFFLFGWYLGQLDFQKINTLNPKNWLVFQKRCWISFEKVAFSGLQNAKNADLQGILWILTTLLLGFPKTVHSVNSLRHPLTPSSLLQKWLEIPPQLYNNSSVYPPPIKGTFWGTSQTWDTASPQGKDTKGMLFTKKMLPFF